MCPRSCILRCECRDVVGSRSPCKEPFRELETFQSVMNVQERGKDAGRKLKQIKEKRNKKELRSERRRNVLREKARTPET